MPGKDPGFRSLAWLTRGVAYRPFSGGAKNPGAPARERNSSIKNPGRSPVGSDGGTMRVHSRQSISTIGAPPSGTGGALHRPVAANVLAVSATVAALNWRRSEERRVGKDS